MSSLYATPAGFNSRRPAGLPPIDRPAVMRDAHRVAKRMRTSFATYREAFAYSLGAAWATAKSNREIRSLRAQVARVDLTPVQIAASREATRRSGSSLSAS